MQSYNIKLNQNMSDTNVSEIFIEFKEEENIDLLIMNKNLFDVVEIEISMFSEGNLIAQSCYEKINSLLYEIGFDYDDGVEIYLLEHIHFELKEFKEFCEQLTDTIEEVIKKVIKDTNYKED